jgi:hypothetical protein
MEHKTIKGYPNYILYEDGSVYSYNINNYLTPFAIGKTKDYLAYKLCNQGEEKTFQAHRLVAKHFIDNPDNLETVNHKDGNKHNNHKDNLEWMTQGDNKRHAFAEGISTGWWQGTLHPRATFTEDEVIYFCEKFQDGCVPLSFTKAGTPLYDKLYRIYRKQNWCCISKDFNW